MSTLAATVTAPSLTLQRRYQAPPEKVFSAWTDPRKLGRWFCKPQFESVRAEIDAQVGGRYRIVARAVDGEEHDVSGVYREVETDRKLVFTWAWRSTPERESLVSITLKEDGGGTIFTLLHEKFFDETARDNHFKGWSSTMDKLEQLFT